MSPRAELSAERIAELVAKEFGMDVADMAYQWQVDDFTGEFKGVVLFEYRGRDAEREGTPGNTSSGQTSVAKKGDAERRA